MLARRIYSGWEFRFEECCWSHSCEVFSCFQVVELVTGGAQVPVTNENKIFYLNLLAQYRLANQVREEVDHFLKGNMLSASLSFLPLCPWGQHSLALLSSFLLGLNELVPENLLAIFDENELEVIAGSLSISTLISPPL